MAGCIPSASGSRMPETRTAPSRHDRVPPPKGLSRRPRGAYPTQTDGNTAGRRVAMAAHSSASVASAVRDGGACNDGLSDHGKRWGMGPGCSRLTPLARKILQ